MSKWGPRKPRSVVRVISPTRPRPELPVEPPTEPTGVETLEKLENPPPSTTGPNEQDQPDDMGSLAETPGTTPELGDDPESGDSSGSGVRVEGPGHSADVRQDGAHGGPHQPSGAAHAPQPAVPVQVPQRPADVPTGGSGAGKAKGTKEETPRTPPRSSP